MAHTQRYWDGDAWTDHVAPTASRAAPLVSSSGLKAAGYALALVFPLVGLLCGLMLVRRGKGRDGFLVITLSVALTVVWAYVLVGGHQP
jgi:hypothetical protein